MNNLAILIKKELLELSRTKKLLIIGIIFIFVALMSPITAKLMPLIFSSIDMPGFEITIPTPTYMDALDQFLKNIGQLATFILIFVVAGAVAEEKANKTLEIILAKPISRSNFILAKYFAYYAGISSLFVVASAIFYSYTVSLFTTFSILNFATVVLLILLNILMIVSLTLTASTMSRNTITAAGIGLVLSLVVLPLIELLKYVKDYAPGFIFADYRSIVENGLSNDMWKPIITTIVIIVCSLSLAIYNFKRQEVER